MRLLNKAPIRKKLLVIIMATSCLAVILACAAFIASEWIQMPRETAVEPITSCSS